MADDYGTPGQFKYEATHYSEGDGSQAMQVSSSPFVLINEDGETWLAELNQWAELGQRQRGINTDGIPFRVEELDDEVVRAKAEDGKGLQALLGGALAAALHTICLSSEREDGWLKAQIVEWPAHLEESRQIRDGEATTFVLLGASGNEVEVSVRFTGNIKDPEHGLGSPRSVVGDGVEGAPAGDAGAPDPS